MKNYRERNLSILDVICCDLKHSNVAISGSTNYGDSHNIPSKSSDLDLIVLDGAEMRKRVFSLNNDDSVFRHLDSGIFDVVCVEIYLGGVRVAFNMMKEDRYEKLCFVDSTDIVVYKDLTRKGITAPVVAPYYASSLDGPVWLQYDIKPYKEGHIIICPSSKNGKFTINSFQEQILTQSEVVDFDSKLAGPRELLTQTVVNQAKLLKTTPLNIHILKKPYWGDLFRDLMVRRYEA